MRPKVMILRKVEIDKRGHYRFYSPYYELGMEYRPKAPVFSLDSKPSFHATTGEQYPYCAATTEKEFVYFLYKKFQKTGAYRVFAFIRGKRIGKRGMYVFWEGVIEDDGWTTKRLGNKRKQYKKLSLKDLNNPNFAKEDPDNPIRYGFGSLLTQSGKKNEKNYWDTKDKPYLRPLRMKSDKSLRISTTRSKKANEMSIQELNNI